jgi:tellurite resistance protein TehA-like permease
MGTGIVSIDFDLAHQLVLSQILLAIDVLLWLGLIAVFLRRRLHERGRWLQEARTPAALTAIAGTAVLGARAVLAGGDWAAWPLLAIALVAWLRLVPSVLRHWQTPTVGVSFVLTVSTESLAVLAAPLATAEHRSWLAAAALVPLLLGLAAYLFALSRIDLRQLMTGGGDHWVFGGALAIATLACARTTAALRATATFSGLDGALEDAALALWAAALLWLPLLLASELVWPRFRYDTRRWSTVFPFGMYAACSVATASVTGIGGIGSFGRVWIWVALTVWLVVFAGMIRRAVELARP